LKNKILPYVTEHREYIEPFFGGGSIFFAKRPAKIETINDLDSAVMGFFRVLRDQPDELIRLCELTPYSRVMYHECLATWKNETDPIRRAWKWFVVARQSFGGRFGSGWGYVASSETLHITHQVFANVISSLRKISDRLRQAQIENTDARKVIKAYTTDTSLCYCDPPYVSSTRKGGGYAQEMTDDDHRDLLALLRQTHGKVLVSGYRNPIYDEILGDWHRVDFETVCHASRKKSMKRTESLWLNPAASKAIPKQQGLFR